MNTEMMSDLSNTESSVQDEKGVVGMQQDVVHLCASACNQSLLEV